MGPQQADAASGILSFQALVPSQHKRKINQKAFCMLTLCKTEVEIDPPSAVANPLYQGQLALGYSAFRLSVLQLISWQMRLMAPPYQQR